VSDRKNTILKAHSLVARSSGTLALALGKNTIGMRPLRIVIDDLRTAADSLESIIHAQD